jgi:hypothetical protein
MYSEESLRSIINQHDQSIKKLEETISVIRAEKRKFQVVLRNMKWEKKERRKRRASN